MTDLKTADGVAALAMGECDGEILRYAEQDFIPKAAEIVEKTCDMSSMEAAASSAHAAANTLEGMLHAAVEQFLRDNNSGELSVPVVSMLRKRVFTLLALRMEREAERLAIEARMRMLADKKAQAKEVIQ